MASASASPPPALRLGAWASGRLGVWASGRLGVWASGRLGVWAWANGGHDDAVRPIRTALDGGINLIDTADQYSGGEAEEIIGKSVHGRRDEAVLAAKGHFPVRTGDGAPNRRGNSRRWLTRAVEDSLRRLGTVRIDLCQVHRPDPATDIDETRSVLSDLVRAGKITAIGASDFPAEQIVEAQWAAERRHHIPFHTEQPPYSLFVRGIEADVLPTARKYGLGVLTWSPLNSGWLTGRFRHGEPIEPNAFRRVVAHRSDLELPGNRREVEAVEALLTPTAAHRPRPSPSGGAGRPPDRPRPEGRPVPRRPVPAWS
ncbi:aldo/keto reductase [Streptomyces sp. NPDC058357]|uniref:aldo/keto reductase n=1 Tax=unclassified Streptomyces TaxID=2593676 RepID=UPI0036586B95